MERVPRGLWLLAAAVVLLRLLTAWQMVLIPEEAYYWMYAQRPAWGYLDHPPMIAWLIAAGTTLAGDSELGVRIGVWLLGLGTIGLTWRLSRDLFGRGAAAWAALLVAVLPLTCGVGFLATPDAPLALFWLLTLVCFFRAYRGGGIGWWLAAGAAMGAAFISKYPAVFLLFGAGLMLVIEPRGRRMLRRPGPWLALLAAGVVASPVILWNAQHDWASFRFQFARRLSEGGALEPEQTLVWLASQLLTLTPIGLALLAAVLVVGLSRWRRDRRGAWRMTVAFGLPWLAVCLVHSLRGEVKPHWALPAYLSLLPAAGLWLAGLGRRAETWVARPPARLGALRHISLRNGAAALVVLAAVDVVVMVYCVLPLPGWARPRALADWRRIGREVDRIEDRLEVHDGQDVFILTGGNYELASVLAFYMTHDGAEQPTDWRHVLPVTVALGGGLNYRYWVRPQELVGRDAVFVTDQPRPRLLLGLYASFRWVEPPVPIPGVTIAGRPLWALPCHDYRGQIPLGPMHAAAR